MTIFTALQQLGDLTEVELRHMIQLVDIAIANYERTFTGPLEKTPAYHIRYRKHLEIQRERFETALLALENKKKR